MNPMDLLQITVFPVISGRTGTSPVLAGAEDFDLEFHVRHIALPQPGDWRQLCIQIARIHARQIDLRRPPWEMTVIEGRFQIRSRIGPVPIGELVAGRSVSSRSRCSS